MNSRPHDKLLKNDNSRKKTDSRRYSPSICKENLEKETVFIIKTEIFIKMSLFYN